jgi:hypothetical protein
LHIINHARHHHKFIDEKCGVIILLDNRYQDKLLHYFTQYCSESVSQDVPELN